MRKNRYDPKEHIQHVEIAPRSEDILDQRQITIRSYKTTVPFDVKTLNDGLERGWLSPNIRFGVFSRSRPVATKDSLAVVLGLQDALSVRAYDYDERRPLWYRWQNVIVDTMNVRYYKDDEGYTRLTTAGGGQRITDERLQEFNNTFLGIPAETVTKQQFDLDKLRDLCFRRFVDRLYMVRFSDPSGQEYRSIDHARFQSRQYIDPTVARLKEVRADKKAKIESFDSDIQVQPPQLVGQVQVRFFIRGTSGSLRLRFPRLSYVQEAATPEAQAEVFYAVVNATVDSILDVDYYANHRYSLKDLDEEMGIFPDMANLSRFAKVLSINKNREEFFHKLDIGAPRGDWLPHLRALDGLLSAAKVEEHIRALLSEKTTRSPSTAMKILIEARSDPTMNRIGRVVAAVLAEKLQTLAPGVRHLAEEALLAWSVDHDEDAWDVDPEVEEISVGNLRWRKNDLPLDTLSPVLKKMISVVLHGRLIAARGDLGPLLMRFNWCVDAARCIPPNYSKVSPALRLIAENCVPASLAEGGRVLKTPPSDLATLDDDVLREFGLPLWPSFEAVREDGQIKIRNTGVGFAISLTVIPLDSLLGEDDSPADCNLPPGGEMMFKMSGNPKAVNVRFMKYGKERIVTVAVTRAPSTKTKNDQTDYYNWASQAEVMRGLQNVLGEDVAPDKSTVSRAVQSGDIRSNGESGRACRINVESLESWIEKWANITRFEARQVGIAVIHEINSRKR